MSTVARFDGAKDVHCGDVGAGKGAVVYDLFDTRADGGNLRREIGKAARPVTDHGTETRESPIRHEPALDHASEHVWSDVAAAKQQYDALAGELGELPGNTGRQWRRGGSFDDAFFQLDDA